MLKLKGRFSALHHWHASCWKYLCVAYSPRQVSQSVSDVSCDFVNLVVAYHSVAPRYCQT